MAEEERVEEILTLRGLRIRQPTWGMRIWVLPSIELAALEFGEEKMWQISGIPELDKQLQACKSKMDKPYAEHPREFNQLTGMMEPSAVIKEIMRERFHMQLVSNASLKMLEMISAFELDAFARGSTLRLADNASAPGSFIMAWWYWVTTMAEQPITLDWMASTLISDDESGRTTRAALGDTYGLRREHPARFMTTGTPYNGDVTDVKYIRYLQAHPILAGSFDVYTSDLGMWVPPDAYNNQEAYGARGNLGQVIIGLVLLRPGGALVTKQFTHMGAFTISLMAVLCALFATVNIVKPLTSGANNSEEYMVCTSYRGAPPALIDRLIAALANGSHWPKTPAEYKRQNFAMPLVSGSCLPMPFKTAIVAATRDLVTSQCKKLDENLTEVSRVLTSGADLRPTRAFMTQHVTPFIDPWLALAPFKVMDPKAYLPAFSEEKAAAEGRQRGFESARKPAGQVTRGRGGRGGGR